jgi:pyruvate kinase
MTRGNYRHTKIVATLGPATESPEQLEKIILAGVDVIRLNMAHATEEWVIERVRRIREVSAKIGRHVAVMMDVKGPEIRTGPIAQPIDLAIGESFAFCTQPPAEGIRGVLVNYAGLAADVTVGAVMLVDSGPFIAVC